MTQVVVRHRITVVDDFRNIESFLSYQRFGALEIWDVSVVGAPHPGYNAPGAAIRVYLNFMLVGVYTRRQDALASIQALITGCPSTPGPLADPFLEAVR